MNTSRLAAFFAITAVLTACATTQGTSNVGDEVLQVATQWQKALVQERFNQALKNVSEDFQSPAWPTKQALKDYFNTAKERGYFARADARSEEVRIVLEANTARIYPIAIHADLGLAVFALTLQLEKSDWKITSAEMELY